MIRKRIITYTFYLLCFLTFFEVILRWYGWGDPPIAVTDKKIEYYPVPSSNYNRYGNNVQINRYGMRSNDFDKRKNYPFHVSILGDSIVYGNHFLDQSETISFRLENKLKKSINSYSLVSAIAASSWGPQNIEAYFDLIGPFRGNIAILIQSSHDRYDLAHAFPSVVPYRTESSISATSDFVLRIWEWVRNKWFLTPYDNRSKLSHDEVLSLTKESLERLIDKLKKHYDHAILYYHNTREEIHSEKESPAANYYFSIAKNKEITFLNSYLEYNKYGMSDNLYQDNIHFSQEGTAYMSSFFEQWIIENLLVESAL